MGALKAKKAKSKKAEASAKKAEEKARVEEKQAKAKASERLKKAKREVLKRARIAKRKKAKAAEVHKKASAAKEKAKKAAVKEQIAKHLKAEKKAKARKAERALKKKKALEKAVKAKARKKIPKAMAAMQMACTKGAPKGRRTTVKGTVFDVSGIDTANGATTRAHGVKVTWTNVATGKAAVGTTDSQGEYTLRLPRCGAYFVTHFKRGYAHEATRGAGACRDPILLQKKHETWTSGVTRRVKNGRVTAIMTWQPDAEKLKFLDLHMTVKGADVGQHKGESPSPVHWSSRGSSSALPYATMHQRSKGLNAVHITKELKGRKYEFWVDCWSCNHFEDPFLASFGMDAVQPRPLRVESLQKFLGSGATVKVFEGSRQTFCQRISSSPGQPHTRWDTAWMKCQGGDSKCHLTKQNRFSKTSSTIDGVYTHN